LFGIKTMSPGILIAGLTASFPRFFYNFFFHLAPPAGVYNSTIVLVLSMGICHVTSYQLSAFWNPPHLNPLPPSWERRLNGGGYFGCGSK
jgi:hypothetical protein